MSGTIPSLAQLSMNSGEPGPSLDASWQWDGAAYQVRYSIEIAFNEQIDGLGKLMEETPKPHRKPHQLSAFELLQALVEFTVQKLWDLECTVPNIDLEETDVSYRDTLGRDNNEPFPDLGSGLVLQTARMSVDVGGTPRGEKAVADTSATVDVGAPGKRQRVAPDGDSRVKNPIEREVDIIIGKIKSAQEANAEHRKNLLTTLLKLQEKLVSVLQSIDYAFEELPPQQETELAEFLTKEKHSILSVAMETVRTKPKPTYAANRRAEDKRLIAWCKGLLVSVDDKNIVAPTTHRGSFFTGLVDTTKTYKKRIDSMTLEHVIPINHMKNCSLVMEFGDPEHLAMLTVFSTGSDNSAKSDKYIPLAYKSSTYNDMTRNTNSVYAPSDTQFTLSRRAVAARVVCAGYLSLFMIERKPDAHTEIGGRYGGIYSAHENEVFELMQHVDLHVLPAKLYQSRTNLNDKEENDRLLFRQEWTWEAGLSLLRWHYLTQPYNPLPNMMYRQKSGRALQKYEQALVPFYTDLISRRFSNVDMMSEMMRREMQQEVTNAPQRTRELDLYSAQQRQQAVHDLVHDRNRDGQSSSSRRLRDRA